MAVTWVAFLLRIINLDTQSLWRDEVDAIRFSSWAMRDILLGLIQKGHNGPLFFSLLRPWRCSNAMSRWCADSDRGSSRIALRQQPTASSRSSLRSQSAAISSSTPRTCSCKAARFDRSSPDTVLPEETHRRIFQWPADRPPGSGGRCHPACAGGSRHRPPENH